VDVSGGSLDRNGAGPVVVAAARHRLASRVPGHAPCVAGWLSYSYLFGPLVALLAVGVLALLLRWAFGHGGSLIPRRPRPGSPDEYGLLIPIAAPDTYAGGELLRLQLLDSGIRATLAQTSQGPRVMIWPADEANARLVLQQLGR
jgi:hypothetical protein